MVFLGRLINFLVIMIYITIMLHDHPLRLDAASELLNQVCSQTPIPDFCLTTIGADPGAATAGPEGLNFIALGLSLQTAFHNDGLLQTLRENTTEPVLRANLEHCSVNYSGAIYALEQSILNLEMGNYTAVRELAGIAVEDTKDCKRVLEGGPLTNENDKLIQLSGICDVIISLLA